ncbi:MAG: PKD domain-containing protein [Candidatus Paceibacterota bacterium]|jgi:PKD repeat protein
MKKLGFLILSLALLFSLATAANAAALVTNISAPLNGATVTVGQAVTLAGTATGGTGTYPSFRWSFSDGSTSVVGQNQTVTFATAGIKTITLTVTDSAGAQNAKSVTVTASIGASQKPVITNIATSNITQTGVTITWTTDIPATSRVIYDTTSHPDISGQVAPNFGYAASTQEADLNKVTSHSVNITGLNPGTKYYLRVLSQG